MVGDFCSVLISRRTSVKL